MIKRVRPSRPYPSGRNLMDFGNALITNNRKLDQDATPATQTHQMSWLLPFAKLNNVPCSNDMRWQDLLVSLSTHLTHQGASHE